MKKTILTIMFAALTIGAAAQNAEAAHACLSKNDTTQTTTGDYTPAQYPDGKEALTKFLTKNVKYPEDATAYGVEGQVIMTFFVNEDGSLSDISAHDCKIDRFNTTKFSQETEARQKELKEHFAKLFAKEGARVIRKMPKWTPSKLNGKPVKTRMNQPIRFSISNK